MKKLIAVLGLVIAVPALAVCWDGYLVRSRQAVIAGSYVNICTYQVMGDEIETMIPFTSLCPISKKFCF
jgi:hypothetical protein